MPGAISGAARDWTGGRLPLRVRAAALAVTELSGEARIAVALRSEHPELRTAACASLLAAEPADPTWGVSLLGATDPVVREAALGLLALGAGEAEIAALLPWQRVEKDRELLGSGLAGLVVRIDEDPKRAAGLATEVASALRRAGSARIPGIAPIRTLAPAGRGAGRHRSRRSGSRSLCRERSGSSAN